MANRGVYLGLAISVIVPFEQFLEVIVEHRFGIVVFFLALVVVSIGDVDDKVKHN